LSMLPRVSVGGDWDLLTKGATKDKDKAKAKGEGEVVEKVDNGRLVDFSCPFCMRVGDDPDYMSDGVLKSVPASRCTLLDRYWMIKYDKGFNDITDPDTLAFSMMLPEQVKDKTGKVRNFWGPKKQQQGWKRAVYLHIQQMHDATFLKHPCMAWLGPDGTFTWDNKFNTSLYETTAQEGLEEFKQSLRAAAEEYKLQFPESESEEGDEEGGDAQEGDDSEDSSSSSDGSSSSSEEDEEEGRDEQEGQAANTSQAAAAKGAKGAKQAAAAEARRADAMARGQARRAKQANQA
jgi:hypothetical protein